MKRYFLVCSLVVAGTLAAQQGAHIQNAAVTQNATQPQGRPVARVNGAVLTDRDLLREMYAIFPYARQHNNGFPKAMEDDIRRGALKMIIFEELVYQEALRRKMTVPAAEMDHALAEFHKQFPSDDEYKKFVRQEVNGSEELVRTKIRRSLLIERMLKLEVKDKAAVSLAQTKTYYQQNLDRFRLAESVSLQTISILPPQKPTPDQLRDERKRADEALKKAKATTNYEQFGLLAEKVSEDDYRVVMGDHHSVEIAKLPPEIVQAALKTQVGQVSDLIAVDQAWCIIRLNAHAPAGISKFEDVKDSLHKELEKTKTEQLRSALGKKLLSTAKVEEL